MDLLCSLCSFDLWMGVGIVLYYDYFCKLEKEIAISQKIYHRIFVKSCSKVILSHGVGNWWVHWSWGLGSLVLYFYWATVSCISVFWFAYLISGLHAWFLFFRTQWYEIAYDMFFTRRELQQSSRVRTFPCWHWQWTHILGILCQNQPPCPEAHWAEFSGWKLLYQWINTPRVLKGIMEV